MARFVLPPPAEVRLVMYEKKRPIWQWVLLYIVIGAIAYAAIYYFFLGGSGGGGGPVY